MLVVRYVLIVSWLVFASFSGFMVVVTGSPVDGKGVFLSLLIEPGGDLSMMNAIWISKSIEYYSLESKEVWLDMSAGSGGTTGVSVCWVGAWPW